VLTGMTERFLAKTPQQRFLRVLEQDFQYAPRIAQAILEEAQECLFSEPGRLKPGQVRVILTKLNESSSQSLHDTRMTEVTWTIDAGQEDQQVRHKSDRQTLRRVRIQRLLSEAIEQGAVATQEDLARALNASLRTIKRDFAHLQAQGILLPTRGNLQGIGRGQTHKALIVGRWLQGETYDQLELQTRHSIASIQRYVQAFVRVVQLHQQGFSEGETAQLLKMGTALVREYLAVYNQHDTSACRERLNAQVQRLSRASGRQKPERGGR
jgi:transcription initiation factor IIE alpha subunit